MSNTSDLMNRNRRITDIYSAATTLRDRYKTESRKSSLKREIYQWEQNTLKQVKRISENACKELDQIFDTHIKTLDDIVFKTKSQYSTSAYGHSLVENDIDRLRAELVNLEKEMQRLDAVTLKTPEFAHPQMMKFHCLDEQRNGARHREIEEKSRHNESSLEKPLPNTSSQCPIAIFGDDPKNYKDMDILFDRLMKLPSMDKNGPMSDRCTRETDQMVDFLTATFGFRNTGKDIVQGVRAFQLARPPSSMPSSTVIRFPSSSPKSFSMTIGEILHWQRSYVVYASKDIPGIDQAFLIKALQGKSEDGKEAFRMKFVVRISTCPILMEFDARVIERRPEDDWPNNIKLVSVTGIDFAARKHDVLDILTYITNWKDVFEVDPRTNMPMLMNERDFAVKRNRAKGELKEEYLMEHLTRMARLRLRACDAEGVQVVVETGIGLGVFSGRIIGIERTIQITSATTIRNVLEEDGPTYKNIRAVIFAMPVFERIQNTTSPCDCFSAFVHVFKDPRYKGPIPVMIADQDMHRLTVAIAKQGLVVSELNPADSHGVFGEY